MARRDVKWLVACCALLASLVFAALGGWCHVGLDEDWTVWICAGQVMLGTAAFAVWWLERGALLSRQQHPDARSAGPR